MTIVRFSVFAIILCVIAFAESQQEIVNSKIKPEDLATTWYVDTHIALPGLNRTDLDCYGQNITLEELTALGNQKIKFSEWIFRNHVTDAEFSSGVLFESTEKQRQVPQHKITFIQMKNGQWTMHYQVEYSLYVYVRERESNQIKEDDIDFPKEWKNTKYTVMKFDPLSCGGE